MNEDGNPGEMGAVLFFQSTLSPGESTTVTKVRYNNIDVFFRVRNEREVWIPSL